MKRFGFGKKKDKDGSLAGKVVVVGPYSVRVESLVGEGGFATIYKAVDLKTGQTFALKHMRLAAEPDAIREVQHEAKTMARLKVGMHPASQGDGDTREGAHTHPVANAGLYRRRTPTPSWPASAGMQLIGPSLGTRRLSSGPSTDPKCTGAGLQGCLAPAAPHPSADT